MPQYKVIYLNYRGRAENVRMAFEQAGIKYEDVRLSQEEFAEFKKKTPFGQVPILEIDGELFAQSNAMQRYAGREAGLVGSSSIDQLRIDMILDTIEDVTKGMVNWFHESDPKKKDEVMKKFSQETVPMILGKFDEMIKKNNTGFSVGKSLTISDIALSNSLVSLQALLKDFDFKKYPALLALQTKVFEQPKIKAWIARRPVTEF